MWVKTAGRYGKRGGPIGRNLTRVLNVWMSSWQPLKKSGEKNLEAYVAFRRMSAEYGLKMQNAGHSDFGAIHENWLKNLESFATAYPECPDTAEGDAAARNGLRVWWG